MRTADGRIFLNDREYHRVRCSGGCGSMILTQIKNMRDFCEECEIGIDSKHERRQDFTRSDRNWRKLDIGAQKIA